MAVPFLLTAIRLPTVAVSWLISITIAFVSSAIFFRVNPALFSLAPWEKGEIYDRAGI